MTQNEITTDDDLLTIQQSMAVLLETLQPGIIQPNTLRRWAHEGRIPARRLGHKLLIRRADVLNLLQPLDAA